MAESCGCLHGRLPTESPMRQAKPISVARTTCARSDLLGALAASRLAPGRRGLAACVACPYDPEGEGP